MAFLLLEIQKSYSIAWMLHHLYKLTVDTLLLICVIGTAWLFMQMAQMTFYDCTYRRNDGIQKECVIPFRTAGKNSLFEIDVKAHLSFIYPVLWNIRADDCLRGIQVNGHEIKSDAIPFCKHWSGKDFFLAKYLHPGENHIRFIVKDKGWSAGLWIKPGKKDPVITGAKFIIALSLIVYGIRRFT